MSALMSIIFGTTESRSRVSSTGILLKLAKATRAWASDGTFTRTCESISMGFQPYYSHVRSHLETGPVGDELGNMVVFDGRLDNYKDISAALNIEEHDTCDSRIILQAFRKWGEGVFGHLQGDWALALWSQHEQALYLSRDHAGTRTLFYECQGDRLRWSTFLDALVQNSPQSVPDEHFAIAFISGQTALGRSPYRGIRSVPPAHYARWRCGDLAEKPHWLPTDVSAVRYKTHRDYEEQFFCLFRNAVDRRMGEPSVVIAELSGGMDSSSIVCMADHIHEASSSQAPLQTLSYFDDTEPEWNERPYFTLVERKRGYSGIHLEASSLSQTFRMPEPEDALYLFPGADTSTLDAERTLGLALSRKNIRVIVSGVGGDELLGGFPNPPLVLEGLLEELNLRQFGRASIQWCIATKLPLFGLLSDIGRDICQRYSLGSFPSKQFPPWVEDDQQVNDRTSFPGMSFAERLARKPTALGNGSVWWRLMETLPHLFPRALTRYEYRYPYLDRELVEFLLAVPKDELQQPGFRRSLMRRSLKSIVPSEILARRRKGLVARGPTGALRNCRGTLEKLLSSELRISALGYVNQAALVSTFLGLLEDRGRELWSTFLQNNRL